MVSSHTESVLCAAFVLLGLSGFLTGSRSAVAADEGRFASMYHDFVTVDRDTGLFRNAEGLLALTCATYVQPTPGRLGANAGPIETMNFDLTKFRADFQHMREQGIRCIYMRIGDGLFLNLDGSWRKISDSLEGARNAQGLRKGIDERLERAAAAGIGPFTYNYELFDYLLDCARAEGIYVAPMIMDIWSIPRKHGVFDTKAAIVYEDTWQRTIRDWSKILGRFADRKVIVGYLIEGECHVLPTWGRAGTAPVEDKDPRLARQFQDFLKRRHGTIEALRKRWGYGYDRANPTYKGNTPFYEYKPGVFDQVDSFDRIPLPTVERSRVSGKPESAGPLTWWLNIPLDPVWLEFGYFKENLYIERINELRRAIRAVDPNHAFILSAAWDGAAIWHPFFVAWDRGRIDCEVQLQGQGYLASTYLKLPKKGEPLVFGPHETVMEVYQTTSPYRPFAASGVGTMSGYGMGEGGLVLDSRDPESKTIRVSEELQDRWTTAILMDNFGNGSALANLWDWGTLVGAGPDNPRLHDHAALQSIRKMNRALETDTFTHTRDARVLILANGPTLNSTMKAVSYNNVIALASTLAMTHVPFDVLTTDTISFGPADGKVDIARYDAIFMPQQFQITQRQLSGSRPIAANSDATNPWVMLDRWLAAKANRVLCVGVVALNDEYFNPVEKMPKAVRKVLGNVTPGELVIEDGPQTWKAADGEDLDVVLERTRVQNITISEESGEGKVESYLTDGKEIRGVARHLPNGSTVYYFGFPLGFSWMPIVVDELSGGGLNEKFDIAKLAAFYGRLLAGANVRPAYRARPSIVAYISDNARAVFLRQRFPEGPRSGRLLSSPLLAGRIYSDCTTTQEKTGDSIVGSIAVDLGDSLAAVLVSIGRVELAGDGRVTVAVASEEDEEGRLYRVQVESEIAARLAFGRLPGAGVDIGAGMRRSFAVVLDAQGAAHLRMETGE